MVTGKDSGTISTTKLTKYRPEESLIIVADDGDGGSFLDQMVLILPILAMYTVEIAN